MNGSKTRALYDLETSRAFYEDRFEHGYMQSWPDEKKKRIMGLIGELDLPTTGEALDFGCGNGVLTEVLSRALPGWKVSGCDLSPRAIENANQRVPRCTFFVQGEAELQTKRFDLLFTHHVLEHVSDLERIAAQIDGWLQPRSTMLHILPCGNPGSFEYNLCQLRKDGMDPSLGNRYFFEDEGHLRRLSTSQMDALFQKHGFRLVRGYYSGQYHGAINWITTYGPAFVRQITDESQATDPSAGARLKQLRAQLLWLAYLRSPLRVFNRYRKAPGRKKYLVLPLIGPLIPLAKLADAVLQSRASREWRDRRGDENGSEMYLVFRRD